MSLVSGTRFGPYEILSSLGAGGMGEVYRARDTRLEREVAIKVLPASYSADTDRLRRFELEARAASQLNHPNIVTVHDFGTHEGAPYVVQELLEGETLRQRIESGSLGTRKATEYALEIAHGLAAAHDKGIVHRDLKPENIFITADDRVKILDFGLAKLLASNGDAGASGSERTATLQTLPGAVMGTAGYMSPEQVRAQPADARSDIFSSGAILYEMLTGRRAFRRDTSAETMTAILKEEPRELSTSGKNVPPSLQRIVDHCLEKRAELRFQSAKDLAFALSALSGSGTVPTLPSIEEPRRRSVLWAAIAAAVAVGLFAAYLVVKRPAPAERMEFEIPLQNDAVNIALSADGRMLALVERDDASGENMLYFEPLGVNTATRLEGTEGASYPFWSQDNASIGFFADGKLQKIAIAGGAPQVLTTASRGRGGSWGSRGVIIYAPDAGGPLWRVNSDGSGAAPLTDKVYLSAETSHRWPQFLPDGEHFLFWSGSFSSGPENVKDGIYFSSLAAKEKKLAQRTEANAVYANGRLYYLDQRKSLISAPFDPGKGRVTGEYRVVSDHVSYEPSVNYSAFAAGGDDTVVYSAGAGAIALSALAWYDGSGKELSRIGAPGVIANPSIAPGGTRVVADIADLKTSNVDIWIQDLTHATASRFTFDPSEEATAIWSRDGQMIAYRYNGAAGAGIIAVKKASGVEAARELYTTRPQDDILPNSWTLDDQGILCTYEPAAGGSNLAVVNVASGKVSPFLTGQASETNGMISPDGKWVAYASNDSGEWEIYVTTFPGAQGKWQLSPGGGTEPRWRGDGKEIFYIDPKGMLTAVPVNAGETFSTGSASPLFPIHGRAPVSNTDLFTYDVSKDGQRFLINHYVKPDHVQPITVVLNATSSTKQ